MNQYAILKWYLSAGITESITETPVDRFLSFAQTAAQNAKKRVFPDVLSAKQQNTPERNESIINSIVSFVQQAQNAVSTAQSSKEIKDILQQFDGCSLKKTAAHTFVGEGQTQKPLVFCVIDAPKVEADKSGYLLAGTAGGLFTRMTQAINLSLETNMYVAPLIPWRLPGDRKPTDSEVQTCLPFLQKQIELIQPQFLLLFGTLPCKYLVNVDSVPKARQQQLFYNQPDNTKIPTVVVLGLDMVNESLRNRKTTWEDLQNFQKQIQENNSNI